MLVGTVSSGTVQMVLCKKVMKINHIIPSLECKSDSAQPTQTFVMVLGGTQIAIAACAGGLYSGENLVMIGA